MIQFNSLYLQELHRRSGEMCHQKVKRKIIITTELPTATSKTTCTLSEKISHFNILK